MTIEKKIRKIRTILYGIHPVTMTEAELSIRDIVYDKKASQEEKKWASKNTEIIVFAEQED